MRYAVWVENADGTGKIVLSEGDDAEKASQLASALVYAASGSSFAIGVSITNDGSTPPPSPMNAPRPTGRERPPR